MDDIGEPGEIPGFLLWPEPRHNLKVAVNSRETPGYRHLSALR